jgi:glycosyltransferase involved in cell wall biosynthesis
MRVSVIIPTYCRAALLCEAIESVLRQDIDGCEIIVIDDGSTDDTRERVRDFSGRVRYLHQENQGLSTARNTGIAAASGDYIAFLDDDDWWMPGKLALQLQILERLPDVAGVYSDFTIIRDSADTTTHGMQTWFDSPLDWRQFMDRKVRAADLGLESALIQSDTALHIGSLYAASLDRYFVLPSTAIVRRSAIPADLTFPDHDSICGDWEYFARLSKGAPLCFVDCDTTYNRSHDSGYRLTRTKAIKQARLRLDFLERVYVADRRFYEARKADVDRVWKDRLAVLCRLQLLESDVRAARMSAKKFHNIDGAGTSAQRMIVRASSIPGAGVMMRLARRIKRAL